MPQEFQVLQCFSCRTFQVHQVKKAKKWACKMCGEKQSTIKVYGRGTGAECRQHVQTLNTHRGEIDMLKETFKSNTDDFQEASHYCSDVTGNVQEIGNKWSQFVNHDVAASVNDVDDDDDGRQFTTDASILDRKGKSRKRKRENYIYQNTAKSSKFNYFNDPSVAYEDEESCSTRNSSTQGARWMGQYTGRNIDRTNIEYSLIDRCPDSIDLNTKSKLDSHNEIHSYSENKLGYHGNVNVQENQGILAQSTGSSKWSSFGENYHPLDKYSHITACTDDVNGIVDSHSSGTTDQNKLSRWSMYEEHSSQCSSDNGAESQAGSDIRQTDTRIYVEFNKPDQKVKTYSDNEIPGCKDVESPSPGKSQRKMSKQSSSKWGQFLNVGEEEEESFTDEENSNGPGNFNLSNSYSGARKCVGESENIVNKVNTKLDIDRNVLGSCNISFKHEFEQTASSRTVLGVNNSQLNHGARASAKVDDNIMINKVNNDTNIVLKGQVHNVKSLFNTGDLTDDDLEL